MHHRENDPYLLIIKCWCIWTVSFLSQWQSYLIRHPKTFHKEQNINEEKGCHTNTNSYGLKLAKSQVLMCYMWM